MSDDKPISILPTYQVVVTNTDAQDALRAIGEAIEMVCGDSRSDVPRVAHDVVVALRQAGFYIVRNQRDG